MKRHVHRLREVPPTRVRLGWNAERGWAVRVTVQLAEGERERAVDVPSCADAFDVIALSLALILDPSFGGQGAEAAEQVGGGAAAHGEDGGQRQQDEAVIGGAGQGRRQRLEGGMDGLGEPLMVAVDPAAGGAGLLGESASIGAAQLPGFTPPGLAA